jgi:hypothetical protein
MCDAAVAAAKTPRGFAAPRFALILREKRSARGAKVDFALRQSVQLLVGRLFNQFPEVPSPAAARHNKRRANRESPRLFLSAAKKRHDGTAEHRSTERLG